MSHSLGILRNSFRLRFSVAAPLCGLAAWFLLASSVRALSPRDELLRLVPDDAVFCLIVQDLRGNLDKFVGSPFYGRLRNSVLGQAVASAPETRKLLDFAETLRTKLNVDWDRLRSDIVGDAVVFTYWPGPTDQPEREQGLALIRARDADVLADLVNRFREAEREMGNPAREAKHQGVDYLAWDGPIHGLYVWRRGPVLAAARTEGVIQRVIERDLAAATEVPAISQRLKELGIQAPLVTLWINARAFVPEMQRQASQLPATQGFVLNRFLAYYKAIDGVALYAAVHRQDVELGFNSLFDPARLPELARKMLAQKVQPSDLWRFFPENALAAGAGRVDAVALTEIIGGFLPDEIRTALRDAVQRGAGTVLDKDVTGKVLPFVGPDCGFCILPPPADPKSWVPSLLVALRLQSGLLKDHPIDGVALGAMDVASFFLVLSYNSNRAGTGQLASDRTGPAASDIRFFTSDQFPAGFQPAYALREGYLVVSTSLDALRGFHAKTPTAEPATAEVLLLRISFRAIKSYLTQRADKLIPYFAAEHHLSKDEESRRYHAVLDVLDLMDRLEVRQRSSSNQVSLTVRARPALALEK